MGCSLTLIKPEHEILDICIEIVRLSYSTEINNNLDILIVSNFNKIIDITKKCDILPQYCLREVRHAVETLNHKHPSLGKLIEELAQNTLNIIRKKSIGIIAPYTCLDSPNQGSFNMKFNFYFPDVNEIQKPELLDLNKSEKKSDKPSVILNSPRRKKANSVDSSSECKRPVFFDHPPSPAILRTLDGSISSDESDTSHEYGFFHEEDQIGLNDLPITIVH